MNVRDDLHRLIDGLDITDAKSRLHVLVAEIDEETALKLMLYVETIRWRRRAKEWGFHIG